MAAETGAFAHQLLHATPEDETEEALKEAQSAIERVLSEKKSIDLTPRRSYLRRLQHELAEKYNLLSFSIGDEPNRRLKILPPNEA
jgi:predicted RNA-binding protein Jag